MALSRAPVNPAMVGHFMRVDRKTAVPSEGDDDWGRGWMTTPDLAMSIANSRSPSRFDTSMTDGLSPTNKTHRRNNDKQEQAKARQAAMAEKTHSYTERSRFMCLGAPMQSTLERQSIRSRMKTTQSLAQSHTMRLSTPISANFHAAERGPRSQAVLRRRRTGKSAQMFGERQDFMERTRNPFGDEEHLSGRIDVVGYGSGTKLVYSNEVPTVLERTMFSDELTRQFYEPAETDDAKENARRQPLPFHKTIPFKNQMILLTKTANVPIEKRVFMSVHKGVLFDPASSLGPPSRISTPSTLNRSRPASAAGRTNLSREGSLRGSPSSPVKSSPIPPRPHTRAGDRTSRF